MRIRTIMGYYKYILSTWLFGIMCLRIIKIEKTWILKCLDIWILKGLVRKIAPYLVGKWIHFINFELLSFIIQFSVKCRLATVITVNFHWIIIFHSYMDRYDVEPTGNTNFFLDIVTFVHHHKWGIFHRNI